MKITIYHSPVREGYVFDCYVDGAFAVSRTHEINVFEWLAWYTREHGPATIEYTEVSDT